MIDHNPPAVSVVVPVFNDPEGLERCLQSLAYQAFDPRRLEVVVVDNGSNRPVVVGQPLPFAVKVIRCTKPGSYASRNAGAAVASGDALAFMDADCVADPEWLRYGLERLAEEGGRSVVGGEVLFEDVKARNGVALYQYATGFQQHLNITRHHFSATANLFCTRAHFATTGGFDERLLSGGDREWAWRSHVLGTGVVFEPRAIVRTRTRTSLRAAIRQTRRVAAGRLHLRQHELAHLGPQALRPHRTGMQAITWIIHRRELSWRERGKVLAVAALLKTVSLLEVLRIRLGLAAERR